jgi:hypothetical protein
MRLRVRWVFWSLVVVSLAACGSENGSPNVEDLTIDSVEPGVAESDARVAVRIAIDDSRLQELLEANPYRVTEVRPPGEAQSGLVVTIVFEEPLGDGSYPLDMCAIDNGGQPITGVVWLIDQDEISAVSPRWGGDIACGY